MDLKTKIEEMKHLADEMLKMLVSEANKKATQDGLPTTLKEVKDIDKQHYTNAKVVSDVYLAFCALSDLFILRKAYWAAAGNWQPDWADECQAKFVIYYDRHCVEVSLDTVERRFLAFPTEDMASHFLYYHRGLIEEAKPLL